jgi:rubredoxin
MQERTLLNRYEEEISAGLDRSSKVEFLLIKEAFMYKCTICGYEYDEAAEGVPFESLPNDWKCPVCNAPKDAFEKIS